MDHKPLAIESYQRALFYNKENVEALRCVASVLRADDKYEDAVEYIKALLVLNPSDGEAHSSLGKQIDIRIPKSDNSSDMSACARPLLLDDG